MPGISKVQFYMLLLGAVFLGAAATDSPNSIKYIATGSATPSYSSFVPKPKHSDAEMILSEMTLEQKIGQMLMLGNDNEDSYQQLLRTVDELGLGGVMLMGVNTESEELLDQNMPRLKAASVNIDAEPLPLFVAIDQEGGVANRINWPGYEITPQTAIDSIDRAYAVATKRAQELAELGINVNFSPVLDQTSNPGSFLFPRVFGSKTNAISEYGKAYVEAYQSAGLAATVKHFPGHLSDSIDSHSGLPRVNISNEGFTEHTSQFRKVIIEASPEFVMMGHILFTQQDGTYPASLSETIIQNELRGKLKYDGLIITDDMQMQALADNFSLTEAATLAVNAGNDILLYVADHPTMTIVKTALVAAVTDGVISEETIDKSVLRILEYKTALQKSLKPGF